MNERAYTDVKVLGDKEFAEDPCALNHVCLPMVEVVNQESTKNATKGKETASMRN